MMGSISCILVACCQSPDLMRILVDAYPASAKMRNKDLQLAFHVACERGPVETVKYLYEQYPESVNARNVTGLESIHFATTRAADPDLEVLCKDPGGVSRAAQPDPNGEARVWRSNDLNRECKLTWYNIFLPLHYAADDQHILTASMDTIMYLFNLYPEALFFKTFSSRPDQPPTYDWTLGNLALIPEGVAQKSNHTKASIFFQQQTEDIAIARDGSFPLHYAIQNDHTLGVVKLLANKWYQDHLSLRDANGNSPLHHACEKGRVDVVNFLLEM